MNLMISNNALLRAVPIAANANFTLDILSYAIGECALGKVLVARSANRRLRPSDRRRR